MPWGWECRAKLIKQIPSKPTERRGPARDTSNPAPNQYETPPIVGGDGFSKIKRAPAYTFGHRPKSISKPTTTPYAPVFNIRGFSRRGCDRIPGSVISTRLESPFNKFKVPSPAEYAPGGEVRHKRPPAYSMRPAARPPYQPWDQWTPPPNMYWPAIPKKKPPAYTLGYMPRKVTTAEMPGPGEHDPNFGYVQKNKPAYSFGAPFRPLRDTKTPPPNTYCDKKFMVSKRSIPAPSFGIRHSAFLGEQPVFEKNSKLELQIKSYNEGNIEDYSEERVIMKMECRQSQSEARISSWRCSSGLVRIDSIGLVGVANVHPPLTFKVNLSRIYKRIKHHVGTPFKFRFK